MTGSTFRRAAARALFSVGLMFGAVAVGTVPAWAIGAIAVDDEAGQAAKDIGYGIGHGTTKEAAFAAAMKECASAGNTACKSQVWFTACGAYAASANYSGIGTGATEAAAQRAAVQQCGKSSCKVAVSACDE